MDHRNEALIIKLPRDQVASMVELGKGEPFAPNGRVFKEWVSIPNPDRRLWRRLLQDAQTIVSG